ncbi:MAG: hypothetical protein ABFD54_13970 [Armatimonadota bacterium]|nr:hypothetical protein [bacterium]
MDSNDSQDRIKFIWSDIWLLQAIATAAGEQSTELTKVISAGDAIMHAILNYEEVEFGLSKLIDAGYVIVEAGRLSISPQFYPTYKNLTRRSRTWMGVNKKLEEFLQAEPYPARNPSKELVAPIFSPEEYVEAIQQYCKQTCEIFRSMFCSKKKSKQRPKE